MPKQYQYKITEIMSEIKSFKKFFDYYSATGAAGKLGITASSIIS
jgi:hypothetical protein